MDNTTKNNVKDIKPGEKKDKIPEEHKKYTHQHFILAKYIIYMFAAFILIPLLFIPIFSLMVPGLGDKVCENFEINFEIIKFFATFMGPILMAVVGYYFGQRGVEKAEERAEEAIIEKKEAKETLKMMISTEEMNKDDIAIAIIEKLKKNNEELSKELKELRTLLEDK